MAHYIDGFIIPIKKSKVAEYKKMAKIGCKVWMEHGALSYYESIGDDFSMPAPISFKKLCSLKANETVIFAFVIYKSKAHRNSVNKKVMKDPRMDMSKMKSMPFDMKRFSVGGFKTIVKS